MALLVRHTAVWTGAPGLPGYSQFYQESAGDTATDAQAGHDDIAQFFGALVTLIPADVTVTVDPIYQILTVATGEVTGEGTVGTPSVAIAGSYVGNWLAQVGVLVEWVTAAFINGRRLRGRTYLVPLGNLGDDDGTLTTGTLGTINSATSQLWNGGEEFVVWHRPVNGTGGQVSTITGAVVRDKAAVLRSRMI